MKPRISVLLLAIALFSFMPANQPDPPKKIKIEFTLEGLNYMLLSLSKMPKGEVDPLYNDIVKQAQFQLAQAQDTSKPAPKKK